MYIYSKTKQILDPTFGQRKNKKITTKRERAENEIMNYKKYSFRKYFIFVKKG